MVGLTDDWRKLFGVLLLAAILAWVTGLKSLVRVTESASESDNALSPPNILLIVTDDLGYSDISALNPEGFHTPNIDQLAANGIAFSRHYADATCSPSRVSILTGRDPERSGFRHRGIMIPSEFETIAEVLNTHGYSTYLVGKWHAGEELREGWPDQKGFKGWFGFLNQWHLQGGGVLNWPTYENPWLRTSGGPERQYQGHLTDILTEHTIKKIEELQQSDTPWFLYHAFLAPHTPIQPDIRYLRRHPNTEEGAYSALLNQLDDSVGKIVQAVGDDANTIIVFVSDNGGTNERRDSNFPFFGKKNEIYEGSYRTPMIMKLPGGDEGRMVNDVVMNTDIYPTLLAAAGLPVPEDIDGLNLLPLLRGQQQISRARSWERYSWNIESMSYSLISGDARWRLSNLLGLKHELFDLETEISGSTNTADRFPTKVPELEKLYQDLSWQKSIVNVVAEQRGEETQYTGFDTLRTPFMFGVSIGLELPALTGKHEKVVLAEQKGAWRLVLSKENVLSWEIGDKILTAIDFKRDQCNRVVLTGNFQPEETLIAKIPPSSVVKLFVNGQLKGVGKNITYKPNKNTFKQPTKVYRQGRAVFLNQHLSSYSEDYSPLVEPSSREMFIQKHKQRQLALPVLERLDQQLCVGQRL